MRWELFIVQYQWALDLCFFNMDDLRQLQIFRAVAENCSFTDGADALHVSQPVVSRSVRELERALGTILFARTTRSVVLTPQGTELLAIAKDLVERFDASMRRFEAFCRGERGSIVVAALPSMAAAVLPRIIAQLRKELPAIRVHVLDVPSEEAAQLVRIGRADLALAEPAPDLEHAGFHSDRIVAVVPSGHQLASEPSATWRALAAESFIAITQGSSVRRLSDLGFLHAGVSPSTVTEVANIATAGGLVAAGLGVSALPEQALPLIPHNTTAALPLRAPQMGRDIVIVTRDRDALSPPAQRFMQLLEEHARHALGAPVGATVADC